MSDDKMEFIITQPIFFSVNDDKTEFIIIQVLKKSPSDDKRYLFTQKSQFDR